MPCPYCCLFVTLVFASISLSHVYGFERSSGCCVILRSRFIDATSNFVPPSVLCRTTALTEHHLYLIVPAPGSHLLSAFSHYHHPVVVCSASSSLALGFIVCAYYFFFFFGPFRRVYFLSDPSSVYIPPWSLFLPNLVLSYPHPFTELLIKLSSRHPFSPIPLLPLRIYALQKKNNQNLG